MRKQLLKKNTTKIFIRRRKKVFLIEENRNHGSMPNFYPKENELLDVALDKNLIKRIK